MEKCYLCSEESIRDKSILVPVLVFNQEKNIYEQKLICLSHLEYSDEDI